MNTTLLILIILLILYIPFWGFAFKSPKAKEYGLEIWGPAIKINTKFGIRFMDRVAPYKRFWKQFGTLSQIIAMLLMAIMLIIMINAVIRLPATLQQGGIGIEYALALPGLNPLMPFWYTLVAFIIALVLHELAHGIQTRANSMDVVHTGLLYGVVPLGAFVEPDEKQVEVSPRKARLDIYSAGIATNFVIAAIAFMIMSVGLLGGISSPYEASAGVYSNQDQDGIPVGQIILEVGEQSFDFNEIQNPRSDLLWNLGTPVTVKYDTENQKGLTKDIVWGVSVATVQSGSPAEKAGLSKGDVVTKIGESYLYSANAFSEYMKTTSGNQTIDITYYDKSEDTQKTQTVVLAEKSGIGFLGISSTTQGMQLLTPNQILSVAKDPTYGADSISDKLMGSLRYISLPFSGFTPVPDSLQWWFNEPFTGFWHVVCIMYWIFWINLILGVTNALPAVPFDGGLILRGWVEGLTERFSKKDQKHQKTQVDEITRNVSTMMLFLLMIVMIAVIV